MAPNKRKILEAARKFAQKGAKDKALAEYEKLLKLDPRDAKLRLEVGDTYRRWGQIEEAAATYAKVADQFMAEGFDARAVAVYKQIQNLDSESFESHEPLAELYQRMGLTAEAIHTLQAAADGYHRAGDKERALGLLRKMAAIDSANTTSRLKVADLLAQEGKLEDAVSEYDAVVDELEQQGDAEGTAKVFERILDLAPDRVATLVRYAKNLIGRGAAERAEPLAKRALELDSSPDHFELLAEVYKAGRRDKELVALYRQLAEVHRERGDEERAREILQRFVPPDEFSTDEPGDFGESAGDLPGEGPGDPLEADDLGFGDESTLLDEDLLADESLLLGEDSGVGLIGGDSGDSLELGSTGSFESVSPEPTASAEATRMMLADDEVELGSPSVDLEQLFAEASVYLRYGKRDQAIANLENIIEQEPEHRGALEKLGEAYTEDSNVARAVEVWSRAAKLAAAEGDSDAASVLRDRISSIDSAAADALEIPDVTPALVPETPVELLDPPLGGDSGNDALEDLAAPAGDGLGDSAELKMGEIGFDDIEIDIDIDAESFASGATPADAPQADAEKTADGAAGSDDAAAEALTAHGGVSSSASTSQQINEDLEEADFYLQQGLLDEAKAIFKRVLKVAPNHPHALVRLGEVAAQKGEDPGSTGEGATPGRDAEGGVALPEEPESELDPDIGADLANWQPDPSDPDAATFGGPGDELDPMGVPPDESLDVAEAAREVATAGPNEQTMAGSRGEQAAIDPGADVADVEVDVEVDVAADAEDDVEHGIGSGSADDHVEDSDDDTGQVEIEVPLTDADGVDVETTLPSHDEPPLEMPGDVTPSEEDALAADESGVPGDVVPEPSPAPESVAQPAADGEQDGVEEQKFDGDSEQVVDFEAESPEPDSAFAFDLAAELNEALDDDANANSSGRPGGTAEDGFAAVFAEFKKGVSATLSDGDHEAHYDLGIAYREMGLLDDAIAEFRAAMTDPARGVGCLHLMGQCALEQGQPEQAVSHYETALADESITDDAVLAIQFALGEGLEACGQFEQAREAYTAVWDLDPQFCDVESRIAALDDPEKSQAAAPSEASDETAEYESFEDFFPDDDSDGDESDDLEEEPESYESFDDILSENLDDDDADLAEEADLERADDSVEEAVAIADEDEDAPLDVAEEVSAAAIAEPASEPVPEEAQAEELEVEAVEAEPVEDSPDESEAAPEEPASKRRKKKISFV